jgi:probable addiction module antidote protein
VATNEHKQGISNVPRATGKTTRSAKPGRPAPSVNYDDWLAERLKDPAEAAAYLEAVISEGDQSAVMLALRQVAQARGGVAAIAKKAKLTREATYKMLSKTGNPELRSLNALLAAAGLQLAVKPLVKRGSAIR